MLRLPMIVQKDPPKPLLLTTALAPGPLFVPSWVSPEVTVDVFALNPFDFDVDDPLVSFVGESVLYAGGTGLNMHGEPMLFYRAENEELRRSFRDLVHEHKWTCLLIDGVRSAIALAGDGGLEVPRELSTMTYGPRKEDDALIAQSARIVDWLIPSAWMARRELKTWDRQLRSKASLVV